jgi:hypothetical protein
MKIEMRINREVDFYLKYDIDLRTDKDLSAKEYKKIIKAIKMIQSVWDPIIDSRKAVQKFDKSEKDSK